MLIIIFISSFYHVYEHVLFLPGLFVMLLAIIANVLGILKGNKAINITMLILNIVFLVISQALIISLIF